MAEAALSKVDSTLWQDFLSSPLDLVELLLRAWRGQIECYSKASTCSDVGWRTLEGAQDMREEVVEDLGIMEGSPCLLLQLIRPPPLLGEATLLSSYSHEVSIVTRLRSWLRLNE